MAFAAGGPASPSVSGRAASPAPPAAGALGPPPFAVAGGRLAIQLCADDVVRVMFARTETAAAFDALVARPTLATAPRRCVPPPWRLTQTKDAATLATARLQVRIDLGTGAVAFADAAGRPLLAERRGGRTLEPAVVRGERTFHVRQQWEPSADESLYGLGQHQNDLLDIKDVDLDLRQSNTEIFVPFLVSSRGWGILWDNTSFSRFGDLAPAVPLPGTAGLYAAGGAPGDVAVSPNGTADWSGTVVAPATGEYLFRAYSSGDIQVRVDGRPVIDHFRQGWLASEDVARVRLTAGQRVALALAWKADIGVKIVRLLWKPPVADRTTSLWSNVGDAVDYTFVYGPALDHVVAGYRALTGTAPMMPRWAFGLWQCRERYRDAKESLEVLDGFRRRGIPVDAIVQDWRYWPEGQWGSHAFDPRRFPDPAGWIKTIHERDHAHVMISVWPKFYPGTANFAALDAAGFLYRPNLVEGRKDWLGSVFTYYDAFDPAARRLYWSQIDGALGKTGVDAWWMDASEPEILEGPYPSAAAQVELSETHMTPTAAGSGARVLAAYPLVNSQGIYEGARAARPRDRVFILTRSGFAGMQRYAATSWSGDITSTWTALRKQVPAGLGFAISGMPYWTFDAGGFSVPPRFAHMARGSAALDEWNELNARWFEYAAFIPILRVHGQAPKREMWEFGGDGSPAYEAELKADRLRYRLLPYVYALAGAVTQDGGTLMRPLVMDFPADARARAVTDEYMFGPAFLVAPVTAPGARTRDVYLPPAAGGWYDFWTGAAVAPGTRRAPAPYDAIPLHVRAGSIVPFGPELQYADEKPADPLVLFVYAGADGAFSLYEDDGRSTDYERGAFSRIPIRWTDATRTLTVGKREGAFPGMLARRTVSVVLVSAKSRTPFSFTPRPAKTVTYAGEPIALRLD
jgi:alpha-D-xyloside xylohydrolase